MKKTLYIAAVLLFVLLSAGTALAQEATSPYAQKRTEAVKQSTKEIRATTTEARKAAAERLSEAKKKTVAEHGKRFLRGLDERLKQRVGFLNDTARRIESRIEKFEDMGASMTAPKAALETARGKIAAFKALSEAKLAELKATIESVANAADPKASLEELRAEVKRAEAAMRESYKAAHQALVDVITSMKGVSSANRRATTTNTTN